MKISNITLAIIVVVIMFGTIITTSALGLWTTTSTKIPVKYQTGEFAGEYNPEDIRGSYTFGDISVLFEIPLADLSAAFNIDIAKTEAFKCNELESLYSLSSENGKEVGTDTVRIFVALYKGLPISLNDATYFPDTVREVLLDSGKMTEEQANYIEEQLVEAVEYTDIIPETDETESTNFIKGKTTFKEVMAIGVKLEDIEASLDIKINDSSMVIRDFCTLNNLEFSEVKAIIQELIDNK